MAERYPAIAAAAAAASRPYMLLISVLRERNQTRFRRQLIHELRLLGWNAVGRGANPPRTSIRFLKTFVSQQEAWATAENDVQIANYKARATIVNLAEDQCLLRWDLLNVI